MEVLVNNEKIVTQAENLEQLMTEQFGEAKGIAAAIGTSVVSRAEWASTPLYEGVNITVIRATRGG